MKHFLVIYLISFLSIFSINILASEDDDNNDEIEAVQIINGQSVVFLDQEKQKKSGIKTVILQQIEFQPEFMTFGRVLSLSPLLSTHNQYLSSAAKQASAKIRYFQAKKNLTRVKNLHKNKSASTRKLQEQQIKWQTEKTIYNESVMQTKAIINKSKLHRGHVLTEWITGKNQVDFNSLINGNNQLLKILIPANKSISALAETAFINPEGNRNRADEATFISVLPQVDRFSQGQQHIYLTKNSEIKPGMNFTAWIALKNQTQIGVIVPDSSLAWHRGDAFVFIKTDDDHFMHKNIDQPVSVPGGYFIGSQLNENREVVVTGVQMLLSHEFKSQIPDEDDDD